MKENNFRYGVFLTSFEFSISILMCGMMGMFFGFVPYECYPNDGIDCIILRLVGLLCFAYYFLRDGFCICYENLVEE